ncbi:MAG: PDZ domain-containing protein [Pyrinomonadaceae bacterium]
MLRKLSVVILLSIFACAAAYGQETPPEPKTPAAVWSMALGGSYLGVQTRDVSKENMAQFGLNEVRGVAIEKVMDDSPAARAGLMNNDVIIRFNGESVTSVRKLTRLIGEVAPDHSARITVLRNGVERDFDVALAKRELPQLNAGNFKFEMPPMPDFKEFPKGEIPDIKVFPAPKAGEQGAFVWSTGTYRQIGVTVTSLSKQLGDYFGVSEGKGVLINNVREDSPAAKAGLRAGDVIVEIDGKAIEGSFDLSRAINEKKEGDITLTIVRDKNRRTVTVTPEKAKDGAFRFGEELEKYLELEKNANRLNMRAISPQMRLAPLLVQTTLGSRIL